MNALAAVYSLDIVEENHGSIAWAAGSRDTGDEYVATIRFEDFFDAPKVIHLEGGDGGADCEGVEAEQAVTEDDWVLYCTVYG